MSIYSIQGQALEVIVIGCTKLKDTEWISRQDPYVCLEYGSTNFRTTTCTDGGRNPIFQEKFVFSLIEGIREINVAVWNSNTVTYDDFIGNGKIQLAKVLAEGYDDSTWSLQTKTGRHAGEVRLILHFATADTTSKFCTVGTALSRASAIPTCHVRHDAIGTPYSLPSSSYTLCIFISLSFLPTQQWSISNIHVCLPVSIGVSSIVIPAAFLGLSSRSIPTASTSLTLLSSRPLSWSLSSTTVLKSQGWVSVIFP
ncbi:uncharacterized protein LOC111793619 isoform X1 [Cucurbita pepo subsp. pepo]|uniref:uncharacterized protein LOC111793619 isoform X1 n=1 Tax=Cucurbita pepo subsp. pepo TaxID=3664 RepID=UPI000C9D91D1|nr:uncharacterized protein LOC111793619 isoform X1 [Cucurbita pepo subsp. pepo]